jgi:hypothetical protein
MVACWGRRTQAVTRSTAVIGISEVKASIYPPATTAILTPTNLFSDMAMSQETWHHPND